MQDYSQTQTSSRYVLYVEDDPAVWTASFDDLEGARSSMRHGVADRLAQNGAGFGIVVDTSDSTIVDCYELDLPVGAEAERVLELVLKRHRDS